jgi:cation-transporting ATPase E
MDGLSTQEVEQRKKAGEVNNARITTSRTYTDIIVKNVFTPINLILFIIGAALLLLNNPISAISATGIITVNIVISTIQEMRAKHRLDKISLLTRPKVSALRDGAETIIDQEEIVKDDVLIVRAGDQALVDGILLGCRSLEMDEALLTGESSTVRKNVGDTIYSGSVCVTGEGYFKVTAFGNESFASEMLNSAKKFTSKKTPLQMETQTVTTALMAVAFALLGLSVLTEIIKGADVTQITSLSDVLEIFIICLDIIPIALFLLITLTYMMAALRMANTGVLLQRFNSVESLSHVDVVCMDKTGTITTNNLVFDSAHHLIDEDEAERIVRLFANSTGSKNKTVLAILKAYGECDFQLIDEIQFSSARKYSAVKVSDGENVYTIYSGAWNVLREHCDSPEKIDAVLKEETSKGFRTMVVCMSEDRPLEKGGEYVINRLSPVSVISIRDEVRPDCRATIDVFIENGMDLKVLSGDDPTTIDALFKIADIPGERVIVTGAELDAMSEDELDDVVMKSNIFGRMKPENKEKVIEVLKRNGKYVAMIGDGVNDVKSLKSAQVGVALESGSGAARGVADMILVNDNFAALPKALVEGRRTISGVRDILKIYLSRNIALAVMFIIIYFFIGCTPMIPVQNMLYAFVAVSVIAFFMTIFAKPDENNELILPGVLRFAIPSALIIGIVSVVVYLVTWSLVESGTLVWDYSYLQFAADTLNISLEEFLALYMSSVSVFDLQDIHCICDIVARTNLVLCASVAGAIQLLIVCPYFKFLSVDGKTNKKKLPFILVALVLSLLVILFTCFPGLAGVLGMATLDAFGFSIPIIGALVCFVLILVCIKKDVMHNLVDWFEKRYLKKLEKEYTKGDVVNVESYDRKQ